MRIKHIVARDIVAPAFLISLMSFRNSTKRSLGGILIGAAFAGVAYSGFLLFKQQRRAKIAQEIFIPPEWPLLTKTYILKGLDSHNTKEQLEWFQKAMKNVIGDGNVELGSKGPEWLTGYSDLARKIGLSLAKLGDSHALDPLEAANTVELGTPKLRYDAKVELYRLTHKDRYLLEAFNVYNNYSDLSQVKVPPQLGFDEATAYMELAELLVSRKQYGDALTIYLGLHRNLPEKNDMLCMRAASAGYAAQLLWRYKQYDDARKWLELSLTESTRKTPSCITCNETLQGMFEKMRLRSQ